MSGTKSEIAYVITRSRSSFGTVRKSRSFQGLPHDFGTDCSPERRFLLNTGLEWGTKPHQRPVTRTHFQSGEHRSYQTAQSASLATLSCGSSAGPSTVVSKYRRASCTDSFRGIFPYVA